ncbi:hypothetical protein C8034_v002813 [Colletotrichum sidae]|uniref:Uncharacterized protein n=1 Tax=Colletotrichum sidae TaxID=1347389 RepID=A0A4V3I2J7_9PEZI|nr:hypothetical protein C8034_v002813 [Colletotrichum sidae]
MRVKIAVLADHHDRQEAFNVVFSDVWIDAAEAEPLTRLPDRDMGLWLVVPQVVRHDEALDSVMSPEPRGEQRTLPSLGFPITNPVGKSTTGRPACLGGTRPTVGLEDFLIEKMGSPPC